MTHSSHSLKQAGMERRAYNRFGVGSGKKPGQTRDLRWEPVWRREGGTPLRSPSGSALTWGRPGISALPPVPALAGLRS